MSRNRILELISVFGSAVATASAVSGGYKPRSRDLRALGIDPEQFSKIRRH
jgi:hypothetical protein